MSEQTIADLRRERDRCEIGFRIARAKGVEWNIKKLEGTLIGRAEAHEAWTQRASRDRAPWPMLSKTLARRSVGKDARKISALLTEAIHGALSLLAEDHPEKR